MKIKFLKKHGGHQKGDVISPGNDKWAYWLIDNGIAKESDEPVTPHAKEKAAVPNNTKK